MECPAPHEIRFLHCDVPANWFCRSRTVPRGYYHCPRCGENFLEELQIFRNVPSLSNRPRCPEHGSCGVVIDGKRQTVRFACLQQTKEHQQPLEYNCELDIVFDGWVVSRLLVVPGDSVLRGNMSWDSYATIFHTLGIPLCRIRHVSEA